MIKFKANSVSGHRGRTSTLKIQMTEVGEDIVGASASISFDPKVLKFMGWKETDAMQGVVLTPNPNHTAEGQFGFLFDGDIDKPWPRPKKRSTVTILELKFRVADDAPYGMTPIKFTNSPVRQSTSDPMANSIPFSFQDGSIVVKV